jgi:rhamnosyltransferase
MRDDPTYPTVSIVIPVYNGMSWLPESIPLFLGQHYPGKFDVLVIDSGSDDGSVGFLQSFHSIHVIEINHSDFNHGRTRNLALKHVASDYLLFTVQDAKPRDLNWLRNMMAVALKEGCEAVCGGQAVEPHFDNNPMEWFQPVNKTEWEVVTCNPEKFREANAQLQSQMCGWDNVNALYSRNILEQVAFPERVFGEDMAWAKAALNRGFKICYAHHNKIWHYHFQQPEFTRKRTLSVCFLKHELFGVVPKPPARFNILKALFTLIITKGVIKPSRIYFWLQHNFRFTQEMRRCIFKFSHGVSSDPKSLLSLKTEIGEESPLAQKKLA